MSTILEALRELEQRRSAPGTIGRAQPRAEEPGGLRRAAETLGIITVGLLIGAALFAVFVLATGGEADGAGEAARVGPVPSASASPERAPVPEPTPAWLSLAAPPEGQATPRTARASTVAPASSVRAASSTAPTPGRGGLALSAIRYSESPGRRSVVLTVDGRAVTLREGESAGGVEVQLILPDSVYVRRGGEVVALEGGL